MTESKISIRNLIKIFGKRPAWALQQLNSGWSRQQLLDLDHLVAVNNVSLEIAAEKIHVIMGLSGSGKTTLLRHINALVTPDSGSVVVDGKDLQQLDSKDIRAFRQQCVSMVFQNFALFPHLTVWENVEFGLTRPNHQTVNRWIDRVGLTAYANYYPDQLSGGMQQRVGLARALATDSDIILMDEAFSALDPLIRNEMQDVLLELQSELNKTIVFITHDINEAFKLGDTVTILKDGALVQQGAPYQIILNPNDQYVAEFVKGANKAQVIKCKDLMSTQLVPAAVTLPSNMNIIDAARILTDSGNFEAAVVNEAGQHCGNIHLKQIMALT
jgi:glycine betaine/proline transport system ATP-binding protein